MSKLKKSGNNKEKKVFVPPFRSLKNLNQIYRHPEDNKIYKVWTVQNIHDHNEDFDGTGKMIIKCLLYSQDNNKCTLNLGLITAENYRKHLEFKHYKKDASLKDEIESDSGKTLKCKKLNDEFLWVQSQYNLKRKRRNALEMQREREEKEEIARKRRKKDERQSNKYFGSWKKVCIHYNLLTFCVYFVLICICI